MKTFFFIKLLCCVIKINIIISAARVGLRKNEKARAAVKRRVLFYYT